MSVTLHPGDCRAVLATLPDASVQCVVTSPPYFGLRQYLPDGHPDMAFQLGLEPSPDAYVAELVAVFREIRRVLADSGVVFLNLGDSYAMSTKGAGGQGKQHTNAGSVMADRSWRIPSGYKPKDLLGIPWLVAFALRADGWWLRSDCIWAKPSPMPESVTDRPTSAHEHVFLLTKSGDATFWLHREGRGTRSAPPPDYRWIDRDADDAETDQAPPVGWEQERSRQNGTERRWRRVNLWRARDYFYDADAVREPTVSLDPNHSSYRPNSAGIAESGRKEFSAKNAASMRSYDAAGRNLRNVWTIPTSPTPLVHFATMPPALASICVRAGTSERGQCPHCASPWARVVERSAAIPARTGDWKATDQGHRNDIARKGGFYDASATTTGWQPTCACPEHKPVPQTVLDPFAGAGTTGLVADRLGRNAVLIELNPAYAGMARDRITDDAPLFASVALAEATTSRWAEAAD